ncbi:MULTISPECIES: hypothetical protein [unclassified Nostoc]|uniref:hypothetical protein n=1 Tax=unclassified Nostoc TaxID=2593658 RepID=UPI0026225F1E|nr:hypothetical protein [Nostoc sp. S13]MDF5738550.1 hypothetical protein [Nostoc sp. S13]
MAVLTAVLLHQEYGLNKQSFGSAFCVNRLPVSKLCKLIVFLLGSFFVGDACNKWRRYIREYSQNVRLFGAIYILLGLMQIFYM